MSEESDSEQFLNISETDVKHVVTERDFLSMMIDLYRNKPVLWKVKHPQYCDKFARAAAVQEIVQELQQFNPDFDEDKFKKKVNTIRTNFNKQRHRVERARAAGFANHKPQLWYYNELLFILEQDNDSPEANNEASNTENESFTVPVIEQEEEQSDVEQKYQPQAPQATRRSSSKVVKKRPPHFRNFKNISVKRRRVVTPQSEEPEDKEEEEIDEEGKAPDPEQYMTITTTYYKKPKSREDLLAEIWAKKLKKLSPSQKLYAEKIINDVFYEGELGRLSKNGVSFCPAF